MLMSGSSPETVCAKMYQLHKMRGMSVARPCQSRMIAIVGQTGDALPIALVRSANGRNT